MWPTKFVLIFFIAFPEAETRYSQFQIFWNVPSTKCNKEDTGINPWSMGIRANYREELYGTEIVTFYEQFLGIYPYFHTSIDPKTEKQIVKPVRGGLPQNVNLAAHLAKAAIDIEVVIPDPDYAGLAVIDYEGWRPIWAHNWATRIVYQTESIKQVRRQFPYLTKKAAVARAKKNFESAAKQFLVETIRLVRRLRPKALVGFFDFPLCNYDAGSEGENECQLSFDKFNQDMLWMYRETNVLLPPIYLYWRSDDWKMRQRYTYAKMTMAKRVLLELGIDMPIYMYTKFEYNTYPRGQETEDNLYTEQDLCNTLQYSAELGAKAVIFWSASVNMTNRCGLIKNYVDSTLQPFVTRLVARLEECSTELCHQKGDCVLIDPEIPIECYEPMDYSRYACVCRPGYMGEDCSFRVFDDPGFSSLVNINNYG